MGVITLNRPKAMNAMDLGQSLLPSASSCLVLLSRAHADIAGIMQAW